MSAPTVSTVNAAVPQNVQNLLIAILEMLGLSVTVADQAFRLELTSPLDGNRLFVRLMGLTKGGPAYVDQSITPLSLGSAGVQAVLTAGVNATIPMVSKATDLFAVKYVTAGGTPGVKYSVERVSGTQVRVTSFAAGNVLQGLDTGTVEVYNLGTLPF